MTLTEFIQTHDGHSLDYDGRYGAQCVDLIDFYCRDVLGIPIVWADAIRWFGQDNQYLDWIHNVVGDPNSRPSPGDIVVWGQNYRVGTGINGHIAIAVSAQANSFLSFDQNWPPNSPCHIQDHIYDGVIGWGHPKVVNMALTHEQETHEIWLALGGDKISGGVNYLGWSQEIKTALLQVRDKIIGVFK